MKNKSYFKKGHLPWNKNLKGKKYLNHFKKKATTYKKDNKIILCKNCKATFKSNGWGHKYCSSNCQGIDWSKNNPEKIKIFYIKNYKKNKEKVKIKNIRYIKKYPQKQKAYLWCRKIKMPKGQICVVCDKKLAKYKHHADYSKIDEVVFCCGKCHALLDIERRTKEKWEKYY